MNKFSKSLKKLRLLPVFITILIITAGLLTVSATRDFRLARNMDIFFSMIREISIFYVDETDPEKLIERGISGVLEGLDPYTTYIPESEKENFATMTTGRYGGVGALIRQVGDHVVIIEPYENFPAQKAGLRSGDIIVDINGESAKGKLVNEVSEMLKGQPGSSISIIVKREAENGLVTKELIREEIRINNVTWAGTVTDGVGYIQLNGFTENAHREVREALDRLKKESNITSLILDVRGNPGGLLMEAVSVTNLFVNKGEDIVSTRGKVRQWDQTYRARNNPADTEIPLVVLTGRSSASAAEIVAGAMQDLDRGVVVGQRTFGKGLIQTTRQLSYDAQLKITTAKYYTPSGRCIQARDFSDDGATAAIPDSLINEFRTKNGRVVYDGGGIMPDVPVEEDRPSALLVNLYTQNHIFNYATLYASRNPEIPPARDFVLSDNDYRDFVEYLEQNNFEYQTQTEANFRQLVGTAKRENYYEHAESLFTELKERIKHDKAGDFKVYRKEINRLLEEEIVSRYYYQKGRVEASIKGDPHIDKALEILQNKQLYDSMLDGSVVAAR